MLMTSTLSIIGLAVQLNYFFNRGFSSILLMSSTEDLWEPKVRSCWPEPPLVDFGTFCLISTYGQNFDQPNTPTKVFTKLTHLLPRLCHVTARSSNLVENVTSGHDFHRSSDPRSHISCTCYKPQLQTPTPSHLLQIRRRFSSLRRPPPPPSPVRRLEDRSSALRGPYPAGRWNVEATPCGCPTAAAAAAAAAAANRLFLPRCCSLLAALVVLSHWRESLSPRCW
ncbi:hypothetical protein Scep_010524 [Stephania cephalantha]|uniref:Uncharacterized protein n=1 Tax=Stephania cephalantha TaxID=152367 RepID=A0AAP0PDE0_9MAGN